MDDLYALADAAGVTRTNIRDLLDEIARAHMGGEITR